MQVVASANLALRFLLELCALVALGYWGFQTGDGLAMQVLLGIGTPLLAAVAWGVFVSPKAAVQVPRPVHLLLQLAVFGAATAGLLATGHSVLALAFALIVVVNAVLMYIWRQ